MEFTYVTLKDIASVTRNQWADRMQYFKVSAYYETAKFKWDQSD